MKSLKKILSIVLALAMVLAMTAITGMAATKGSITINNAADGQQYKIYKILDASVNASGGIDYDITSVVDDLKDYFVTTTKTEGNVSYTLVSLKYDGQVIPAGGSIPSGLQEIFYDYTTSVSATGTVTASNGKAVFTDVAAGYYIIISPLMDTEEKSAIIVDSATNPAAVINEKNSDEPVKNLTKNSDEDNVAIGDTVEYTISFGTSNYSGSGDEAKQIVSYVVKDALPAGLTGDTYTIKVNGTDVTTTTTGNLFGSAGAVITWAEDKDGDGVFSSLYPSNSIITVTYSATVNAQATGSLKNTVTVTPKDKDNNDTDEPEEGEKTIYTYKLSIKKVDEDLYELSGAEFELYDASENGNRIYVTGSNGNYKVTKDQAEIAKDIKIAAGTAVVDGLDADKSYYLAEVTAPDGYNKITTRIEVKATLSSKTEIQYTQATEYAEGTTYYTKVGENEYIEADGVTAENATNYFVAEEITIPAETPEFPEASVVNKKGAELPETGGIGTTIFYMIGTILVFGAGVLLITRRRMNQ